jgi:hypothetical protein
MQRLIRVLGIFLLVLSVSFRATPAWAQEVIGTVKDAAERSTLAARAQALLSGIVPQPQQGKDTTEDSTQMKEGQYLLWGELFEKGRTQAVVDLGGHLALADWDATKAAWTVQQVIKAPIYWRHPAAPESEFAAGPDDLPTKPFWVTRLAPSVPRLLVISTGHTRYHAARFIFAYDASAHRLDADNELYSVAEPVLREGHVVLTTDSGRKAWWGVEYYYQVEKEALKYRGSLREGSYNGDDLHLHVGFMKPGSVEEITWRFNATAEDQSTFKIQAGEEGPAEDEDPVIGSIRFLGSGSSTSEEQGAYLLHKLTGLPAALANARPFSNPDSQATPSPPTDRDVEVTGNAEVLQLLGPNKKPPPEAAK